MKLVPIALCAVSLVLCFPAVGQEKKSPSKNLNAITQKAEGGDPAAQYELGIMYLLGDGVSQEIKAAKTWIVKSAEQGYAQAQFKLGIELCGRNLGGSFWKRDVKKGAMWMRRVAEQGYADAQSKLAQLMVSFSGASLKLENREEEGIQWLLKAAEQGDEGSQFQLGIMYRRGKVVPKDDRESHKWIRKAAERGYAFAQDHLAWDYQRGRGGVPQDQKESIKWLQAIVDQGDAAEVLRLGDAHYRLGMRYASGQGVPKNKEIAARLFQIAAEYGLPEALPTFAELHIGGEFIPEDYVGAYVWWRMAEELWSPAWYPTVKLRMEGPAKPLSSKEVQLRVEDLAKKLTEEQRIAAKKLRAKIIKESSEAATAVRAKKMADFDYYFNWGLMKAMKKRAKSGKKISPLPKKK